MSYVTIEAAVLTVLRIDTDYTTDNSATGDMGKISKGLARVVNIKYGSSRREPLTITTMRHLHTIFIDSYVPYAGRMPTLHSALNAERDKILTIFAKYPRLNATSGVYRAEIMNGDYPEPLSVSKGPYRGQRFYMEVDELVKPARAE